MIEEILDKVLRKIDLSAEEMEGAISLVAEGKVPDNEISEFLVGLAKKTETADEITGAARAMRKFVSRVHVKHDVLLDTCGTGGDNKHTFNISTVSAFVVAGAGIVVAKHGNRSVSGSCGSADLLEAFGVNINTGAEKIEQCINDIGIGFLFAPGLHPAMRHVQSVRKALKMRTMFNVLGPLINPAYPTHQLLGVYDHKLVLILAKVLQNLGLKHAMVVWGDGGFDEATTTGKTYVCEMVSSSGLKEGHLKEYVLEPEKLGLKRVELKDIVGGDVEVNRSIASGVLKGMEGPHRDIVLLNAACSIYLAGRSNTIKEGMMLAAESIDSGHAIKKLNKLIEYTNS